MRARILFLVVASLLLVISAQRLPAPIREIPESPKPITEQSAKPKQKRTIKLKAASDNSESSTRRQTPSSQPQSQTNPQRNEFDGAWTGTLSGLASFDSVGFTLVITTGGTQVNERASTWSVACQATCEGKTMNWTDGNPRPGHSPTNWTLTPNPSGKTALVTSINPSGFLGINGWKSSATFYRTLP
jgi:hypothetical protein